MRKHKIARCLILAALAALCLLFFAGCAPSPDDAQVVLAIREALSEESGAPEIDFSTMTVPTRYSGKALTVVFSADGVVQRGYVILYDKNTNSFKATLDYHKRHESAE